MAQEIELELDEQWEKQIQQIFQVYDKKSTGSISSEDLCDAIRSCGIRCTDDQLNELKNESDIEHKGELTYKLFVQYVQRAQSMEIRDAQISAAFEMFIDENGFINIDKFKHAMMTLGHKLTKDELETILKDAGFDPKVDSTIHYTKILSLVQNNVF
eukprot:CAMPEP_0197072830 /NCGR_PEP_ID=MMETSP1384-20130603/210295_1 /TAXON_ID=29189 /ORGANISM="Ammonia sp." /LENGTH=156 /DNA_ID=CAMNT_0042511651 /DNA_START=37 /DNA_END=507 /DNA_ORIENTATION=+